MRTRLWAGLAFAVAAIAVTAWISATPAGAQDKGGARGKWEYKVVVEPPGEKAEKALTKLGEEGWELVAVTTVPLEAKGGIKIEADGYPPVAHYLRRSR
jgi:Domain of unknown function (DUF4177)